MATTTATKNKRKPAHGARLTGEQNAEKGFTATKELGDNLQKVLVDLIELASQGKQAHWNVIGTNFRDTHLQLDEIIDAAREFSDTIAERMPATVVDLLETVEIEEQQCHAAGLAQRPLQHGLQAFQQQAAIG